MAVHTLGRSAARRPRLPRRLRRLGLASIEHRNERHGRRPGLRSSRYTPPPQPPTRQSAPSASLLALASKPRFADGPSGIPPSPHLNSFDLCDPLRCPACPSSPTDQWSSSLPFGPRPLRCIPPPPLAPQTRRLQTDRTTVGRLAPHLIRAIYLSTGGTVATFTDSDAGGRPWPGRAAQSRRRHPRQGRPPALPPPGPGCSAPPVPCPSRSTPSPR